MTAFSLRRRPTVALAGAVGASGDVSDGVPAWRAGMAANTWKVVTTSTIADVDPAASATYNPSFPSAAPWRASTGQQAVLDAWASPTFDDSIGLVRLCNGGHSNYAGNEMYGLNLYADAPAWAMLRAPSGAVGNTITLDDGQEASGVYADGRPRSNHNYNCPVAVPGVGYVAMGLGFVYSNPLSSTKAFWFKESTQDWVMVGDLAPSGFFPGDSGNSASCYDPVRNKIVRIGVGNVHVVRITPNIDSDSWTVDKLSAAQTTWNGGSPSAMLYIPTIDRYLHLVAYLGAVYHKLCHPETGVMTDLGAISGSLAPGYDFSTQGGAEWCPELGCVLLFNQTSNTAQVSTLTPSGTPLTTAWTGGTLAVSGSNAVTPPSRPPNGMFGMTRYSPTLRALIYQSPWADKKLYAYAIENIG